MFKLQSILLPNFEFKSPDEMYFQCDRCYVKRNEKKVILQEGDVIAINGYYNIFSVAKWKNQTTIDSLTIRINGVGSCAIGIYYINEYQENFLLEEVETNINKGFHDIDICSFDKINNGYFYIKIRAIGHFELLSGGGFFTKTAPCHEVKLGIVITHFNRLDYVVPSIRRIRHFITENDYLKTNTKLIVVDNSQNISISENTENVDIIKNKNLGGSGGFTRGLLRAQNLGLSHCLFMDDDGSCELDSIWRVFAIYSFAKDPALAIIGALLSEERPCLLLQTGALYSAKGWKGINFGLDLSKFINIAKSENNFNTPAYGAWPFFAFPIAKVKRYPFPFFVRGDDVLFGLQNEFHYLWWPGISVLVDDGSVKENPGTIYHDVRAIFVINLITNKGGLWTFLKTYKKFFFSQIRSLKYGSAATISLAAEHVLKGPDFFKKNLDCSRLRDILKQYNLEEKYSDNIVVFPKLGNPLKRNAILRLVTFNGILFPGILYRNEAILQYKSFSANASQVFGYRKILYFCPLAKSFYIATYNSSRKWREILKFIKLTLMIIINFRSTKRKFINTEIGSESFWREIYS